MIRFKHKGDFKQTEAYLKKLLHENIYEGLEELAQEGVAALADATRGDSGKTASSWTYTILNNRKYCRIIWENTNVNDGVNIAIILQYGHGTGTGGYVEGVDYINPSIKPIFDQIAEKVWKEVTSA